ncbi:MAG TPA: hypothetical protein VFT99_25875 [Roseiflexaceae bacterium]|nr:hypothetical protein [Roseiflexaceae bacterium]
MAPLAVPRTPLDANPAIDDTCHLYRSPMTGALLLLSQITLEYDSNAVALATSWTNVANVRHESHDDWLWLFSTPARVHVRFGSGQDWYSTLTRAIPLRQFGFPANRELRTDLLLFAPHLRRSLTNAR